MPKSLKTRKSICALFRNNTYETKDTVLELDKNIRGHSTQYEKCKAMALGYLNKLYRFKGLSSNIKLKLYNVIVRFTLLYPIIPLHAQSRSQLLTKGTEQGLDSRTNLNFRYRKNGDLAHASLNFVPNVRHCKFFHVILSNSYPHFYFLNLKDSGCYFLKVHW